LVPGSNPGRRTNFTLRLKVPSLMAGMKRLGLCPQCP